MMALGAAVPYIAAAYALYRVISGVGTGRDRGPAYQEWSNLTGAGAQGANLFAGAINNPGGGTWAGGHYDAQLASVIGASSSLARLFGGSLNSGTQFGQFTSTSPDGLGAQVVGDVRGANGRGLYYFNQNAGNADRGALLAQMIPGMIMAGLQDANLPARISEYFNTGIDARLVDQATLDRMVEAASAAHAMAEAFADLGGPFAQFADMTVDARLAILELTGGLDAFTSKMQGYYSEFYSQEERAALALVDAQRTLQEAGIDTSGITSRESYRALVESIDPRSNPEQFAALINAAGSFASGSDILGLSGMNLREFTAGAPGLNAPAEIVTAQDTTNTLLGGIYSGIVEMIDAVRNQAIQITVTAPVGSEVGMVSSSGN
jgi:hypothetical protein